MNALALLVVLSLVLAMLARSFWRQIFEVGVLLLLFVFFVGILTLVTEGRLVLDGI
jgi:hypothetical protein